MQDVTRPKDYDWKRIVEDVEKEEWEEVEPGMFERSVFLGSVLALTPSGKYYTFWCSNFTEEDQRADVKWFEELEKEAGKHGLYVTSDEGDPCNIHIGQCKEE